MTTWCYRVVVGVERDRERNITREDTVLATSRTFVVDWSSDYSLSLHKTSLGDCPEGDYRSLLRGGIFLFNWPTFTRNIHHLLS